MEIYNNAELNRVEFEEGTDGRSHLNEADQDVIGDVINFPIEQMQNAFERNYASWIGGAALKNVIKNPEA